MAEKRFQSIYPRESPASRGYDSRWRKFREAFLAANPLCVICAKVGVTSAATVVDHIEPHRGDMELFWRAGNHQAACAKCHNSIKQKMEKSGVEIGCDESGMPLDPGHRWNNNGRPSS